MNICILGGGLSGVSLAYFLQDNPQIKRIDILEKNKNMGGLCHSFKKSIYYDIGPCILFLKDKEILNIMIGLLGENKNRLRRSNKIFYKRRFVKYPFENELFALLEKSIDYYLNIFLYNTYEKIN